MNKLPRVVVLHELGAITTAGNSAWIDVSDATEMEVHVNATIVGAAFTAMIRARDNNSGQEGVTGKKDYDMPYDLRRYLDPLAADDAALSEKTKRNILAQVSVPTRAVAIYKHLPAEWVRLRWQGTSATFEAKAILK